MQNNLAPIILFVYNRPWHTQQTLDALAKNELANESILYIYADGAKENATEQDLQKIKEVRKIISTFEGCKEAHIIAREKNWGLANNVIEGITKVINQYGKVIVIEDDILVNSYFLDFMNKGLDLYKNENHVYGITGYSFYSNDKLPSTFLLPLTSAWGWATWQRAWNDFESDAEKLLHQITSQKLEKEFNFGSYPYFEMLENQVQKSIDSWAIRFYASVFLNDGFFVFPNKNIVVNIGMDASGTHSNEEIFENQKLVTQKYILEKITEKESKRAAYWIESKFSEQFSKNKKTKLNNFFAKLNNLMK